METFKDVLLETTGYECKTTFAEDFEIAERFGADAIKDTFNRAFNEWKGNVVYLTELVIVTNWKIYQWYGAPNGFDKIYNECWEIADQYACDNLEGDDARYFYDTTD